MIVVCTVNYILKCLLVWYLASCAHTHTYIYYSKACERKLRSSVFTYFLVYYWYSSHIKGEK